MSAYHIERPSGVLGCGRAGTSSTAASMAQRIAGEKCVHMGIEPNSHHQLQ